MTRLSNGCSYSVECVNLTIVPKTSGCCIGSNVWKMVAKQTLSPPSTRLQTLDVNIAGQGFLNCSAAIPAVLAGQFVQLNTGSCGKSIMDKSKVRRIPPTFAHLYLAALRYLEAHTDYDECDPINKCTAYKHAITTMWYAKALQSLYKPFADLAVLLGLNSEQVDVLALAVARLRLAPAKGVDAFLETLSRVESTTQIAKVLRKCLKQRMLCASSYYEVEEHSDAEREEVADA